LGRVAGQCTLAFASAGSKSLTATYAGTSNFNGSASAAEAHAVSQPNRAPTATVVDGKCSASNIAWGRINLVLADADGDNLTVALVSNGNPRLVHNASVAIGGSGNNRTIDVTAAARKSGIATLRFAVSDGTVTIPVVVRVTVGTSRRETLNGRSGIDMIFGLGGTDRINGNAGNDLLCGGNGNDTLNGGDGQDTLSGDRGRDGLNGGAGDDILRGGPGNDVLIGGTGDDALSGGSGNDVLIGRASADFFSGGTGSDTNTDFNAAEGDTRDGT
jgi:Ca2+-binding RTX toxin-like protein